MSAHRFFFYGTLMDPLILGAVIRRNVDPQRLRPAVLPSFRRVFHRTATYPVLIADATASVDGILASGLTARDAKLLAAYEGPDYRLVSLSVRAAAGGTVRAGVFLPVRNETASTIPWRFEAWRRYFGERFLRQVRRCRDASAADRHGI